MKKTKELKTLCVWCGEVWTANMELEEISISEGCDTCGWGSEASATVEITCDNCGKVVYRKEFEQAH